MAVLDRLTLMPQRIGPGAAPGERAVRAAAPAVSIAILLLSACGGGGEATPSPAPAPPPAETPATPPPSPSPAPSPAPAPAPVLVDKAIGSPAISYRDPELNTGERKITWQDGDDRVWIADLDPVGGEMRPADGRGVAVGQAAPITGTPLGAQGTFNGPEWGYSQAGPAVYFTQPDERGTYQIARHRNGVTQRITSDTENRSGVLPSQNPNDMRAAHISVVGRFSQGQVAWAFDDQPTTRQAFPVASLATSGPRWVADAPIIITNVADAQGFSQVALFDTRTGVTTAITSGAENKFDTFFFRDPANRATLFATTLSVPGAEASEDANRIGIYREQNGLYLKERELSVAAFGGPAAPGHFSLEPFEVDGRGYLSLAVSTGRVLQDPSSIWVLAVDGRFGRKISNLGPEQRCIDPETLVTDQGAPVYYYNLLESGNQQLRVVSGFLP